MAGSGHRDHTTHQTVVWFKIWGSAPMRLVKVGGQGGGMTTWFRTYCENENLWLYFGPMTRAGRCVRLRSGGMTRGW
jgi:hypothetical protein